MRGNAWVLGELNNYHLLYRKYFYFTDTCINFHAKPILDHLQSLQIRSKIIFEVCAWRVNTLDFHLVVTIIKHPSPASNYYDDH